MTKYARRPRDRDYLLWIRTLPCILCLSRGFAPCFNTHRKVEAAHVGDRAFGQKCPDKESLPLCRWHHRLGPQSHHRLGKKFWSYWNLDRDALIREYTARYERTREQAA